jgi:phosphatidylserine decarboxylase
MNSTGMRQYDPTAASQGPAWLPFAPWGLWELNLLGWSLVAIIAGLLWLGGIWQWLAIGPAVLLFLIVYFFRDPPRRIPDEANAIVAPADGTIVDVTPLDNYDFLGGPAIRVGIFLSIFNVHINRAPFAGKVIETHYKPGQFLNALKPESVTLNESMWIGFETLDPPLRRFAVRQISGMFARRIVCKLRPGQPVSRGAKFGMIKLGSRTELILPPGVEVCVKVGDKICAGRDTLARWR